MDQKKSVPMDKLLQAVALGNKEPEVLSSIAVRLSRIAKQATPDQREVMERFAGGRSLNAISKDLVQAMDPDQHRARAQQDLEEGQEPTAEQIAKSADQMMEAAVRPLYDAQLREAVLSVRKKEQIIDNVSEDQVLEAGYSADALTRAQETVRSFEEFLAEHKDEITALQVLYTKPYRARLRFDDIKELADQIKQPPRHWTQDRLWHAYAALEKSKVRGASAPHLLTDLVSLIRFATQQDQELVPFPERVQLNFQNWLSEQEKNGNGFSDEQRHWLEMIRDHIAANLSIDADDFEYAPFAQEGGLGRVHQIFGDKLDRIIDEMNEVLAA